MLNKMKIIKFIKNYWGRILILFLIIGIFVLFLPQLIVSKYSQKIIGFEDVENYDVAIVFGAGVLENGKPSDVLNDRLKIAEELYSSGKVNKILVSGDNRAEDYNEPEVMKNHL